MNIPIIIEVLSCLVDAMSILLQYPEILKQTYVFIQYLKAKK